MTGNIPDHWFGKYVDDEGQLLMKRSELPPRIRDQMDNLRNYGSKKVPSGPYFSAPRGGGGGGSNKIQPKSKSPLPPKDDLLMKTGGRVRRSPGSDGAI